MKRKKEKKEKEEKEKRTADEKSPAIESAINKKNESSSCREEES